MSWIWLNWAKQVVGCLFALPQRHPMIFQTFDNLTPGQNFILLNDHDPKPLYYQFLHEREGQFSWEYLEEGPETWRLQIGRIASA